jgi:hypothetical protein
VTAGGLAGQLHQDHQHIHQRLLAAVVGQLLHHHHHLQQQRISVVVGQQQQDQDQRMLPLLLRPMRSAERKKGKLPGKRRRSKLQLLKEAALVMVSASVVAVVAAVEVVVAVGFDRRRVGIWMHQSVLPFVHYAQRARSLPQFVAISPEMYCLP